MENANWLNASKEAITQIIEEQTAQDGKINYKKALFLIVQD